MTWTDPTRCRRLDSCVTATSPPLPNLAQSFSLSRQRPPTSGLTIYPRPTRAGRRAPSGLTRLSFWQSLATAEQEALETTTPQRDLRRRHLRQPHQQRARQPGHHLRRRHRSLQGRRLPAHPRRPPRPHHPRRNPPPPQPRLRPLARCPITTPEPWVVCCEPDITPTRQRSAVEVAGDLLPRATHRSASDETVHIG